MDETISLLQNEIMINVFEYLPVDDIKACRLVCRNWYAFCNVASITAKEKFVFRRGLHTPEEINEFLDTCNRDHVSIDLHAVPLVELRWQKFGARLTHLRFLNCPNLNELKVWTIFLTCTPNLKHLELFNDDYVLDERVFEQLDESQVVNSSVKMLIFTGENYVQDIEPISFIQTLCKIFPSVNALKLPEDASIELQSDLRISSSITILSSCLVDLREPLGTSLSTIENLQELDLLLITTVKDHERHFRQFFSRQIPRMEKLCLHVYVLPEANGSSEDEIFDPAVDKKLLFYTLRSYKNLKKLHFLYRRFCISNPCTLSLSHAEFEDFIRLTSNLRELEFHDFVIESDLNSYKVATVVDATHKTPMKLKTLIVPCFGFNIKLCLAQIIERFNLQHLELNIGSDQLRLDADGGVAGGIVLSEILRSQKDLRTLKLFIEDSVSGESSGRSEMTEKVIIRHEKLEHLDLTNAASQHTMIDFLFASEFPNLLTLIIYCDYCCVGKSKPFCEYLLSNVSFSESRRWLAKMPFLKVIKFTKFASVNLDECFVLFKGMKRLQIVELMINDCENQEKIIELFANCPALKYVHMHDSLQANDEKVITYSYCRSRKYLYRTDALFYEVFRPV